MGVQKEWIEVLDRYAQDSKKENAPLRRILEQIMGSLKNESDLFKKFQNYTVWIGYQLLSQEIESHELFQEIDQLSDNLFSDRV